MNVNGLKAAVKRQRLSDQIGLKKNQSMGDFPGGPVIKNLPSNSGNVGSIPGQGSKIPHATG